MMMLTIKEDARRSDPDVEEEDLGRLVVVVVVVGFGFSLQHCLGRVALTSPLVF